MDYDEFERRMREQRKKNFESFQRHFNEEMRKNGRTETLADILGGKKAAVQAAPANGDPSEVLPKDAVPVMPPWDEEQMALFTEYFLDIFKETTDEDPRDLVLRAMAVYRSFVKHARAGGRVKFVKEDDPTFKPVFLKVRLR